MNNQMRFCTCVSVTLSNVAISARSADDKYFFCSNCFSNSNIWRPVKVVRAFFFFVGWSGESPSSVFFRFSPSTDLLVSRWLKEIIKIGYWFCKINNIHRNTPIKLYAGMKIYAGIILFFFILKRISFR